MAVPTYAIYQLTSMYMKGIQAGIQGGHAANELAAKHIDGVRGRFHLRESDNEKVA